MSHAALLYATAVSNASALPDKASAYPCLATAYPNTAAHSVVSFAMVGLSAVKRWYRRRQTVAELGNLDDHLLQDIGLARSEIEAVAARMARHYDCAQPWLG